MQEVEVWVSIHGNYCNFHEMSFYVEYDLTNNKQVGDNSLKELESMDEDDRDSYYDYEVRDAVLVDGKYYVHWGY